MKHLLIICSLLLSSITAFAQTGKEVLDATSKLLTKSTATRVVFTGTNFCGTQETGNFSGTIVLKGNKYNLDSDMIRAWFDGETLWTILNGSEEVNVSIPTEEELQGMNPLYFINLYKQGFALTCDKMDYNGTPAYIVKMRPTNAAASIAEMSVIVSQATKLPLSIRMKKGTDWFRIRISECELNLKLDDTFFRFDQGLFPSYDMIDLR
jgi:outer membrane lipoprotein-sorting protein